jgi:hypothetical protein
LVIDRALAVRDAWRAQNPRSEFQIDREFEPIFEPILAMVALCESSELEHARQITFDNSQSSMRQLQTPLQFGIGSPLRSSFVSIDASLRADLVRVKAGPSETIAS